MSSSAYSRAVKGWLAGCAAATIIIVAVTAARVLAAGGVWSGSKIDSLLFIHLAGLIFVFTCVLSGIPAVFIVWLSEKFRLRSVLFFGCVGAVIGALSQGVLIVHFAPWPTIAAWPFGLAGFVAGIAYWRIAGRHAGRGREAPGDLP